MIGYVKGVVSHLFVDYCFIDVHGIGYRVFVPNSTRQQLTVGAATTLITYLNVREDALSLYGFHTQEEYDLFLSLLSVSGIGPKVAINILSAITPQNFCAAVGANNAVVLTKLPGIGKKTAERIILELKDKIGVGIQTEVDLSGQPLPVSSLPGNIMHEATLALIALGYNNAEIMPVLKKLVETNSNIHTELSVEQIIKLALKEFVRG